MSKEHTTSNIAKTYVAYLRAGTIATVSAIAITVVSNNYLLNWTGTPGF